MENDKTDEELLARIGQRDGAAIREMVARKLPRILSLASRMLDDRSEAEDVAQEAFLRIWKQANKWETGIARFDTWLNRVTLNLCYDRLRRPRNSTLDELADSIDPSPMPDEMAGKSDEHAKMRKALASLPERQREAIVLQYYQELSNTEAAAVMEVSVEALESLLARGRRNLRQLLQEAQSSQEVK